MNINVYADKEFLKVTTWEQKQYITKLIESSRVKKLIKEAYIVKYVGKFLGKCNNFNLHYRVCVFRYIVNEQELYNNKNYSNKFNI